MKITKMLKLFTKLHRLLQIDACLEDLERRLRFKTRYDALIDKALNSTQSGISAEHYCDHEVIVSLTSYGRRIFDVAATIESIMQGSVKPNRIVLWLGEDMRDVELPVTLQRQMQRGLEVAFCKDIGPHTKLIPSLKKWPDAAIITIDDDNIYRHDLIENLLCAHKRHPRHIIANRILRIRLGKDGRPLTYSKWDWEVIPRDDSPLNFFTGSNGVLYPPHCLADAVLDEETFTRICPTEDDIWFFAMSLLAGTRTVRCNGIDRESKNYILKNDVVQGDALCRANQKVSRGQCKSDLQLKAVFDKYNLWDKLLEK